MSEITHPELKEAACEMMLANIDFNDNEGSNNADHFWSLFERARDNYRNVKERLGSSREI